MTEELRKDDEARAELGRRPSGAPGPGGAEECAARGEELESAGGIARETEGDHRGEERLFGHGRDRFCGVHHARPDTMAPLSRGALAEGAHGARGAESSAPRPLEG